MSSVFDQARNLLKDLQGRASSVGNIIQQDFQRIPQVQQFNPVKPILRNIGQAEVNAEKNIPLYGQLQAGIRNTVAPIMRNFTTPQQVQQYQSFSQPNKAGIAGNVANFVGSQVPYIPLMIATAGVTNPVTTRIASTIPAGKTLSQVALSGAAKQAVQFAPYGWMGALNYAKTPQERVRNIGVSTLENAILGGGIGVVQGVGKYALNAIAKTFPKATPEMQKAITQAYIRDLQTGRFKAAQASGQGKKAVQDWVRQRVGKKPGEPVFHSDLQKALQGGFIDFGAKVGPDQLHTLQRGGKLPSRDLNFSETPRIEEGLRNALAGASNPQDEAQIVKEFTDHAITTAKGNSLKATRAALNKELTGLAGEQGNYKSNYAAQQILRDDPNIGARINALQDAILKIDDVLQGKMELSTSNIAQSPISSEAKVTKEGIRVNDVPTQTEIQNRAELAAGKPDLYTQRQIEADNIIQRELNGEDALSAYRRPQQKPSQETISTTNPVVNSKEQELSQLEEVLGGTGKTGKPKLEGLPQADQSPATLPTSRQNASTKSSSGPIINGEPLSVKQKVGILDYLRTPDRVLNKIGLGKEAGELRTAYDKYTKELPQELNQITEWSKRVTPEGNVKIFKYLDGQPVTLSPEESKVAEEVQSYLKVWADKLGLPEDRRITNYITHIFNEDFIQKEFDPNLAKLIRDKVPGSVYDPFVQERLGAQGYIEDTWQALDAYVKRGVRKYNLDPVLKVIKGKADNLEDSQFNYVKQYIDRVNMRPTPLDNLIDNSIKQVFGYRFGQRPIARISRGLRQMGYRGALGLNLGSALRNLSQGANTYAKLGEKYTTAGYFNLLTKGVKELQEEGVLSNNIIEDRTINATKKFWEKTDKGLFFFFDLAEKINRGAAYYGAKAQYLAKNKNATEQEAIDYAKKIVRDTQFTFGSIDTPPILQGDINKTLLQFQSYNLKQAEFLGEMVKNKDFAGLARYSLAGLSFVYGLGQLIGAKPTDLIPFWNIVSGQTRIGETPAIQAANKLTTAAVGGKDQYGNELDAKDRLSLAGNALTPLIPAGVQGKKTIQGIDAVSKGYSESASGRMQYQVPNDPATTLRATLFGKNNTSQGQEYINNFGKSKSELIYNEFQKLSTPEEKSALWDQMVQDGRITKANVADVKQQFTDAELQLSSSEKSMRSLGVADGSRARRIYKEFKKLRTPEEKQALWEKYVKAKIITKEVAKQLMPYFK